MKRRFLPIRRGNIVVAVWLVTIVLAARAQQPPQPGMRIPVTPHVEPSAAAQLQYCNQLARKVYDAPTDNERLARLAEVSVNLGIIPRLWPTDRVAVMESYLLAGDLDLFAHAPRNAQEKMTTALPLAGTTEYAPLVERRLAAAYAALGDNASAEAHFTAAEASPGFARLSVAEREKTLRAIAGFFSRTGKPLEAAARYRVLATLPGARPLNRALDLLASAQQSARVKDHEHAAALADLAAFAHAANQARGTVLSADENILLNNMERDAARLRHSLTR